MMITIVMMIITVTMIIIAMMIIITIIGLQLEMVLVFLLNNFIEQTISLNNRFHQTIDQVSEKMHKQK